jgi:hypothetical protein
MIDEGGASAVMDYTALTLADLSTALEGAARDVADSFGALDSRQMNWRPDAARWSVAQCLEHLLAVNRHMRAAAENALSGRAPRSLWQRLPVWPGVLGRIMIRSQRPDATRKFTAPTVARPEASDLPADTTQRFIEQQRAAAEWLRTMDEGRAARTVMTSPFVRVITYSVLDGCRLIVAHDHRHLQQARRVTQMPGFPQR